MGQIFPTQKMGWAKKFPKDETITNGESAFLMREFLLSEAATILGSIRKNKMSKQTQNKSGEQIDMFALSTTAPIILNEVDSKKKPKVSGFTEVMNGKGNPFKKDSDRFFDVATDVSRFNAKGEEVQEESYEDRLLAALAAHRGTGAKLAKVVHEGLALGYTEKYIIGIAKEAGYSPQSVRNCFCKERTTKLRASGGGRKTVAPKSVINEFTAMAALLLENHSVKEVNAALQYVSRQVKEGKVEAKKAE